MNGGQLWRFDEARKEQELKNKQTLREAVDALDTMWGLCLEEDPGLPEKMPEGLVEFINDVTAFASQEKLCHTVKFIQEIIEGRMDVQAGMTRGETMTEAQACYDEAVNEIDIPICENCLKELTDPTHQFKILTEVKTLPDGSDVIEDVGFQCLELPRVECLGCGEFFNKDDAIEERNGAYLEYWCKPCFDESEEVIYSVNQNKTVIEFKKS